MNHKKHIGQISETNLLRVCAFIRELQSDEDLFIEVNKGVIRAVKRKVGEPYKPFADNDFIECMFLAPDATYPKGVIKLTFSN